MKLLFICKYNVFRSRISEEYFRKINRNRKIEVLSRGIIMGGKPDDEQIEIPRKILGVQINKRKPIPIAKKDLQEADLIIIVADDVPKLLFNYHSGTLYEKIRVWKLKDETHGNKKNIQRITLEIKDKIEKLVRELNFKTLK